jgi:hypothetical protein
MSEFAPSGSRWARLRARDQARYPAAYHRTWFPVVERHPNPEVQTLPGYIWLDMEGKVQSVWALHFEVVEEEPS